MKFVDIMTHLTHAATQITQETTLCASHMGFHNQMVFSNDPRMFPLGHSERGCAVRILSTISQSMAVAADVESIMFNCFNHNQACEQSITSAIRYFLLAGSSMASATSVCQVEGHGAPYFPNKDIPVKGFFCWTSIWACITRLLVASKFIDVSWQNCAPLDPEPEPLPEPIGEPEPEEGPHMVEYPYAEPAAASAAEPAPEPLAGTAINQANLSAASVGDAANPANASAAASGDAANVPNVTAAAGGVLAGAAPETATLGARPPAQDNAMQPQVFNSWSSLAPPAGLARYKNMRGSERRLGEDRGVAAAAAAEAAPAAGGAEAEALAGRLEAALADVEARMDARGMSRQDPPRSAEELQDLLATIGDLAAMAASAARTLDRRGASIPAATVEEV